MATIKLLRNRLLVLLVTTTAVATFVLRLGGAENSTVIDDTFRGDWPHARASQLIFFAVLEGLYRDGVKNDDVDLKRVLKTRPVGAPGLQDKWIPVGLCRPRALTRRSRRVFKTRS